MASINGLLANTEQIQQVVDQNNISVWIDSKGDQFSKISGCLISAGWTDRRHTICCVHPTDIDAKTASQTDSERTGIHQELESNKWLDFDIYNSVGYSVPFEDTSSSSTKVLHMTAEIMIQSLAVDPLMSRYSVIVLSKCHIRSIEMDLCLGFLKKIVKKRDELRILVSSSSSSHAKAVSAYLGDATVLSLDAITYPVDIQYTIKPVEDFITNCLETALSIIDFEVPGNTVLFLPGRYCQDMQKMLSNSSQAAEGTFVASIAKSLSDLERIQEDLQGNDKSYNFVITPMQPHSVAQIITASYVIDSGFQDVTYSKYGFASFTKAEPISQDGANLRALVSGLTHAGKCFRLYTKATAAALDENDIPDIQRLSLDQCVLQLKSVGVDNILRFDFISSPPASLMVEAMNRLSSIGALDDQARLTKPFGEQLAQLPLRPSYAHLLIKSLDYGCFDQILSLVAMLLTRENFFDHEKMLPFVAQEGDALTYINIFESYTKIENNRKSWCMKHGLDEQRLSKASHVWEHLLRILQYRHIKITRSPLATSNTIRKCIASVYGTNSAYQLPNGHFQTVCGSLKVQPHPSSVIFSRKCNWIVFEEAIEHKQHLYVKNITVIEKEWITDKIS